MASDTVTVPEMEERDNSDPESGPLDETNPSDSTTLLDSFFWIIVSVLICLLLAVLLGAVIAAFLVFLVVFFVFVLVFPFLTPLITTILYLCPNKSSNKKKKGYPPNVDSADDGGDKGMIYVESADLYSLGMMDILMMKTGQLFAAVSLILEVWLFFNLCIPGLKRVTLLGSPLWKWSLGFVTFTISYYMALYLYAPLMYLILWFKAGSGQNYVVDYYHFGLSTSGTLVLWSFINLLLWVVYFGTHNGLNHPSILHHQPFDYATWTFIFLFAGSVLWLLKTFVLLKWKASVIYRRFEARILMASIKFIWLCFFINGFFQKDIIAGLILADLYKVLEEEDSPTKNLSKYILTRKDVDISYLLYVGRILTNLAKGVRFQEEDGVSVVLHWFQHRIHNGTQECRLDDMLELLPAEIKQQIPSYIKRPELMNSNIEKSIMEEDPNNIAKLLHTIAREGTSSNEFTFDDLKRWMVNAHNDCVNVGRTILDAKQIVIWLDKFLSAIILVVIVLSWLLTTGIATTRVLVAIATPILALSFMFGDTAKSFFQGLVFCFATNPINVGDRCVIDQTELEVQSISILTTKFTKIETNEKLFYPNSELSTKPIFNLGWQPDPTDIIELTLASSTDIENLENEIHGILVKISNITRICRR